MNEQKFIEETAKAWGLEPEDVKGIRQWIDENIEKSQKSRVFEQLLRRRRGEKK